MILIWLPLFIGFLVCSGFLVPRESIQKYATAPKDWQYWTAHILFYSIPASSYFADTMPSPLMVAATMTAFIAGSGLFIWARRSNPYFSPEIALPAEVVTDGAYDWLDHPGYAGMGLMATSTWLMIGHSLAVIPLAAYLTLLLWRARKESSLIYQ